MLALLATVGAVASLATSGRGSAWPRAAAGLGLVVLGGAFAIFIKADVPGSQVRSGAYLTMLGGGIVFSIAAIRPDFRIRIDVDPSRGLALALCAVAFAVLVASGLVDFMTVKNDFKVRVFGDPPEPEAIQWIQDNTEGRRLPDELGRPLHRTHARGPRRLPGLLAVGRKRRLRSGAAPADDHADLQASDKTTWL